MPRFLAVALLLLPGALSAQSFTGRYVYQSPQGPVTLVLEQQGQAVAGTMTGVDGTVFRLEGALEEGGATGTIRIGEGAGFFALGFVDGQLKLVVAEVDPSTGEPDLANGWNLDFARADGAAAAAPLPNPAQPGPQPRPQAGQEPSMEQNVERDPALVGRWLHTDTYRSGDFFANTRLNMLINPDGTYLYGAGNISLGGAYIGRSGGGDVTGGKWRTQGGVVYIMEDGAQQWTPYARYYVEGGSMMFTFADGKRQLWNRN